MLTLKIQTTEAGEMNLAITGLPPGKAMTQQLDLDAGGDPYRVGKITDALLLLQRLVEGEPLKWGDLSGDSAKLAQQ